MAEACDSPGKPLQILMPAGISVGAAVPDFGLRLSQGFTTSLAGTMCILLADDLQLTDDEVLQMPNRLQAVCYMKGVYKPAASAGEEVIQSLKQKMAAADRLRPDPISIYFILTGKAKAEGVTLPDHLDRYPEDPNCMQTRMR